MRAGPDSPFPHRPSISDATADWMRRRPKRPKHKCVNGVKKVAYRFRTLRRSKRVRTKLIRRRVSKRVNQWTERETRYDIKTKSWSVNGWCHFPDPGVGSALWWANRDLERAHAQCLEPAREMRRKETTILNRRSQRKQRHVNPV